jgi:hypothetical protein
MGRDVIQFVPGHRAALDPGRAPELTWNPMLVYDAATGTPRECEVVDAPTRCVGSLRVRAARVSAPRGGETSAAIAARAGGCWQEPTNRANAWRRTGTRSASRSLLAAWHR